MEHSLDVNNNAAPAETPENLVTWMTDLLAEKGHPHPEAWKRLLKPGIESIADPNYQAFEINRAWRNAISETIGKDVLSAEESMDVRYTLVDKCEIKDWKQAFTEGALPCILKHQLPLAN
jgi:hypothetical protein